MIYFLCRETRLYPFQRYICSQRITEILGKICFNYIFFGEKDFCFVLFFFFPLFLCIGTGYYGILKNLFSKNYDTGRGRGVGEWHPQTETNWSPEASCLASLNRTHLAWFLWPRWADQLQLAAWSFGSPRLCLLISKCIIAYQICILFQRAEYFQMSYKILCWKYPRTDFSRNSQGADSLFITPNYPFTVSLTFLITDSLMMIVLFLATTDAEIH